MIGSWTGQDAARVLRGPTAADDKYSRGVLGVRTGSDQYPGAAVLGVEAAWRTGLGMVRYLGPSLPTSLVLQRRPETVTVDGRVQGWLIGSGTDAADRSDADTEVLRRILTGELPVVVDAGALNLALRAAAPRIVTPHRREHARLRALLGLAASSPMTDAERAASALETAAALGATVVLKGSVTIVASPTGWVTSVSAGTPWLATAGTGDVLAGAIGAVVVGGASADDLG
ncbi:ADP-dependent NAD(P)H-hydrate dehydratase, partial [Microbacterium sp.]|uniref:ADP-dependent NAD(P)H-hydrate dehydratase n=1 Tax=Microbacterium sp. TaxID=51671 RepID=UPI003C22FDF4